jgi:RNA polymerase sigma-70 factor (ECF subfamily)
MTQEDILEHRHTPKPPQLPPARKRDPDKRADSLPKKSVLHSSTRQNAMNFHHFDQDYLDRLRAADYRTQEHFVAYFGKLIELKLRSRVRAPEAVEDIRQETFSRVLAVLRSKSGMRQAEKLGAFVNSTCNNVLLEYYRSCPPSMEEKAAQQERPDSAPDALTVLISRQIQEEIHRILGRLSERDRRLLKEVMLENRNKDEMCEDLKVDRGYLRVLLHRAKQSFKAEYLRGAHS